MAAEKMNYIKSEKVFLKHHPDFNEKWLQQKIEEDPSILGLGDLILKDKERMQPFGGRLDLLLQEPDSNQRYEVEIQLGKTDESHIIRTIEYWDIEKKRYPQYEHIAVIIAEDITSRFFNIISLFNGFIPLIAIQMNAVRYEDKITLVFTTILDQRMLGMEEEEEKETVDRAYWEKRGTKETVGILDEVYSIIKSIDPAFELKYNKFYIGLAKDGQSNNFAIFQPQKIRVLVRIRMKKSEEIEERINESGIDLVDYENKTGRYRIRLGKDDIKKKHDVILELLKNSYSQLIG